MITSIGVIIYDTTLKWRDAWLSVPWEYLLNITQTCLAEYHRWNRMPIEGILYLQYDTYHANKSIMQGTLSVQQRNCWTDI